jgi:uncharacterized protein YndB with AHSA1/START domain
MVRTLFGLILVAAAAVPAGAGDPVPATPVPGPSFVNEGVVDAPIGEVWKIWTTPEGWKALAVTKVDMDFRVGGLIRSHYGEDGVLGDPGTIQNRILAYEPPRMLAIQIAQPPAGFPFKEAWKHTWTVISLDSLDAGHTRVRVASLGFGDDDESKAMASFFEKGNGWTLEKLQARFGGEEPAGPAH